MSDLQDPRVLFAAERTLLAWNRTSLALLAFGFILERAGLLLRAVSPQLVPRGNEALTFWLGLAFILLGAGTAAYSSRQYLALLKTLSAAEFPSGYTPRWGLVVNLVVAALGGALAIIIALGRS